MADLGKILIIPKGDYSNTETYSRLDVVFFNRNSYILKVPTATGISPTDADTWQLLAEHGRDGSGGGADVNWNQIVTQGTKIGEITIDGKTTEVFAPEGGGVSDWNLLNNRPFKTLGSDFIVPASGTDKDKLKLSLQITEKLYETADDVPTIKNATTNDKLVSAIGVKKFANKYTERFTCTIPADKNVKGIWQDGDPSTWIIDEDHMVILPMFYETDDNEVEATFLVSDKYGEYVTVLGYQHAPQTGIIKDGKPCGGLCIKIGEHEHEVKLAIDITRLNNEIFEDATV